MSADQPKDPDGPTAPVTFRLDGSDTIVEIGGDWSALAVDDGTGPRLVGSNLFDHISGHFTRRFLKEFLGGVRAAGKPAQRQYRCDSPKLKRVMEMDAVPDGEGITLVHRVVAEEPLPFPVHVTPAPRQAAADHLRCSICNRLRLRRQTSWQEPEACADPDQPVVVIYTVCNDCRDNLRDQHSTMKREPAR